MLLLQVVLAPIDFDLAKLPTAAPRCGHGNDQEILVCAAADRRLPPPDARYQEKPVRAIVGLGNGKTLQAHVEAKELTPGVIAQRAMVTLSIPFGPGNK